MLLQTGEMLERPAKRQRERMLLAICLGSFVSHFTAGVVNVALPQLMNQFQVELGSVQWVTTGYLLAIAASLPVMGKWGDLFGTRTIHNLGYVFFTISSILVALSPTLEVLLLLRVLQALGAAMYQATNIAVISVHVPKDQRGRALGIVSTSVALGAMTGPVAGGLIAEWLDWRWLFLIHVPVSIAATIMAYLYIPKTKKRKEKASFDFVGAALYMLLAGSAVFAVSNGSRMGWGLAGLILLLAAFIMGLCLLLFWEKRQREPLLPIQACRQPIVAAGLLASFFSFVAANTALVVVPFYLSDFTSMSTDRSGAILASYPIALAVLGPIAGKSSDRYGIKRFAVRGLVLMGAGSIAIALFLFSSSLSVWLIVLSLATIGAGMGLAASPNISLIMQSVPAKDAASMSSMVALTRNMGLVFGSAMGLGLLQAQGGEEESMYATIFSLSAGLCFTGVIALLSGYRMEGKTYRVDGSEQK